jgi:hypothetical protein
MNINEIENAFEIIKKSMADFIAKLKEEEGKQALKTVDNEKARAITSEKQIKAEQALIEMENQRKIIDHEKNLLHDKQKFLEQKEARLNEKADQISRLIKA